MSNNYKYSLQDAIGQGVFSTTYPAIEVNSQKPVIVKALAVSLTQQQDTPALVLRFVDLAHKLSRCHHPHLPKVWECFTEDDLPYLVSDRIVGPTLHNYVETYGPIPENLAFHWLSQIATAVQVLHQSDILHLDIHPDNIIYRQEWDDVVLVDAGLALGLTPEISQTHANLRPPGYAAPEQHEAVSPLLPAADVYALSATLYYFLTATAPPPAPLRSHISTDEWFELPEETSPKLANLLMQGLSLNPQERPQSPELWLRELNTLINQERSEPVEAAPEAVELPAIAPEPKPAVQPFSTTAPPAPTPAPKVTPLSATTASKLKKNNRKSGKRNAVVSKRHKFPLGALVMTSLIAASAGAGFGLSLRLNRPADAGSSFWHLEQSFPPRDG